MRKVLFGVLFLLLIAGLFFYYQYTLFKDNFKYKVLKTSYKGLDNGGVHIELSVQFDNPMDVQVILTSITADIYLNNSGVATVKTAQEYVMPKHGSVVVPFLIDVSPDKLFSSFTLANLDKAPIDVKALVNVKIIGLPINGIPVSFSTSLHNILN